MSEKMNLKIQILTDERELNKLRNKNIHSLNRRMKDKKEKINIYSKCNIK